MTGFKTCAVRGVLLLLLAWLPLQLCAATLAETPRLRRLGVAEGLPSRMVLALAQDRQGYIWAATDDGLARYDGLGMRVWRHDPQDPDSLPANALETLLVDPLDRVWVGSNGGGLSMLDAARGSFRHFPQVREHCPQQIWSLAYAEQALWIGTSGSGLCRMDESGQITRLAGEPNDPHSLPDDTIFALLGGKDGQVWVGTGAGLALWNGQSFERIAEHMLGQRSVIRLTTDRDGGIWAGTYDGLYRVDADGKAALAAWPQAETTRSAVVVADRLGGYWVGSANGLFRGDAQQLQPLQGNLGSGFLTGSSGVLDLLQDHEGGLWVALLTQGLAYLPPDWRRFSTYYQFGDALLESQYLLNSVADGDGFLIVGAHGLYRLDAAGELQKLAGETQLGRPAIWSALPMQDNVLWLGRTGKVSVYRRGAASLQQEIALDSGGDPQHRVDVMKRAADGSVWLSITNYGLQRRSKDGRLLEQALWGGAEGLPDSLVEQLAFSPEGELLVANGVGVIQHRDGRFQRVEGITEGRVHDIVFAGDGSVWLARDGALEHYRREPARWVLRQRLAQAEGVPAVAMGGLVLGNNGQVWATTSRGLLAWRPQTRQLQLYGERDGLPDVEFTSRPPATGGAGRALAVSATGLVVFDPDAAAQAPARSPLVIDRIQLRRAGSERSQQLPVSGPVRMEPGDRDLRITARLLSYVDPQQHRYRFKVSGYDPDWIEQGADPERILSSLPAGRHRIEVQAALAGGPWSDSQTLQLQVLPPWWRTPLALVAYGLMALAAMAGLFLAYRRRVRRRTQWQLALQKQQIAEQASQAKTDFLAMLGHEVRTPMTGVLGMSELLLATPLDPTQRGYVGSIFQAGTHLLRLVNETLDLARIEAGRLELENLSFDLGELIDEVTALMAPLAQQRQLGYFRRDELPVGLVVQGDPMRVRQILLNLLGNAIKFTEHGQVQLQSALMDAGNGVRFEVSDTGPGITAQQQLRLFMRFEQLGQGHTRSRDGGSGLGLAICKELVAAMKGDIRVESSLGAGATFIVELPLAWSLNGPKIRDRLDSSSRESGLRVLLVEDDPTVAEVIVRLLEARGYHVQHAAHGLAALAISANEDFDVGLLDLDLPAIDGFALAAQLRDLGYDFPLIAITARSDTHAETTARVSGFDGFLRKPLTGDLLVEAIADVRRRYRDAGEIHL